MNNKYVNFFMQWKVIIPLALIVLVWFFWPQKQYPKLTNLQKPKTQSSGSNSIAQFLSGGKKFQCSISNAKAVIDDGKVAGTITTEQREERIIFDGDCLFRWNNNEKVGQKSCGLKSYLPLLSQFGNLSMAEKIFPQASELGASCKEVKNVDKKHFTLPKDVKFETVSLKL